MVRPLAYAVATLVLAWAATAGPSLVQEAAASLLAAHRGGALLWPENSLRAFRGALDLGADYLEFDVHLSRDGEVIVIHDPTLDRTTTGTGPVRERTLAELRRLRLKDRGGAATEEPIPTLDDVAARPRAASRCGGRRALLSRDAPGTRLDGVARAGSGAGGRRARHRAPRGSRRRGHGGGGTAGGDDARRLDGERAGGAPPRRRPGCGHRDHGPPGPGQGAAQAMRTRGAPAADGSVSMA